MYTQEQWEEIDADGTQAMEKELKQVLEGVAQQLFGNVEARPGLRPTCVRPQAFTIGRPDGQLCYRVCSH